MRDLGFRFLVLVFFFFLSFSNLSTAQVQPVEFPSNLIWINTDKPVELSHLRGKFVVVHFWGYAGVNVHSSIQQIKELQKKYPAELVVIGVHSVSLMSRTQMRDVNEAMNRYGINYPVVVDDQSSVLKIFRQHAWPSVVLISPDGKMLFNKSGESNVYEYLHKMITRHLPQYKDRMNLETLRFMPPAEIHEEGQTKPKDADVFGLSHKVMDNALMGEIILDADPVSMPQDDIESVDSESSYSEVYNDSEIFEESLYAFQEKTFSENKIKISREFSKKIDAVDVRLVLPSRARLADGLISFARVYSHSGEFLELMEISSDRVKIKVNRILDGTPLYVQLSINYVIFHNQEWLCKNAQALFVVPLSDYPEFELVPIDYIIVEKKS